MTEPTEKEELIREIGVEPIRFIQFMMPYGTQKEVTIDRPRPIAECARRLAAAGFTCEIEMLSDYQTISMEVIRGDHVLSHQLARNGPDVLEAVDRMILEAAAELKISLASGG